MPVQHKTGNFGIYLKTFIFSQRFPPGKVTPMLILVFCRHLTNFQQTAYNKLLILLWFLSGVVPLCWLYLSWHLGIKMQNTFSSHFVCSGLQAHKMVWSDPLPCKYTDYSKVALTQWFLHTNYNITYSYKDSFQLAIVNSVQFISTQWTFYLQTSWFPAETVDGFEVPKPTTVNFTSSVTEDIISWLQSSWDGPIQSSLQPSKTVWSHWEPLVWNGLEARLREEFQNGIL